VRETLTVPRRLTPKRLGERLRGLRKRAGLTQSQVAEAVGVSHESISRLERGEQWSTFAVLSELAAEYGVELADLSAVPPAGRRTSNRAALQEVVDILKPRSKADLELARDVVETIFEPG
jgi:transcriptional regulator with XRE-family HTH domain